MELGRGDEEVVLIVEDGLVFSSTSSSPSSCSVTCQCRICHEEEEERSTSMESPCACCGTLKFAHRECIQRWCDEKGSTLCEICLQNFESGYTVAPKKALIDIGVTIRGSLEVPRQDYDPPNPGLSDDESADDDYAQCAPASGRGVQCCRSVAMTFTAILLLRHFISVITLGADHYAFTLFTVFVLRASGILLPFYLVMRMLSAMQQMQRQHWQRRQQLHVEADDSPHRGGGNTQLQHHTIEIRS